MEPSKKIKKYTLKQKDLLYSIFFLHSISSYFPQKKKKITPSLLYLYFWIIAYEIKKEKIEFTYNKIQTFST